MLVYWKNKVTEFMRGDVGKRVLSTILAVIMVFGLLPEMELHASAASAIFISNASYL